MLFDKEKEYVKGKVKGKEKVIKYEYWTIL